MKRAWRIIPFAALAAALMLAAGCSDGSSEDWSGAEQVADASAQDAQVVGEQGAQDVQDESLDSTENVIVTEDDVLELIQEIGKISGDNNLSTTYTYWDFPSATLDEDDGGLLAVVSWHRENDLGFAPVIYYTLPNLRERGKVSTELLSVDLSKAEWDEYEEGDETGRTQTEKESSGYRYVTVKIELAEGASGELPEELQAITIAFDPVEATWNRWVYRG